MQISATLKDRFLRSIAPTDGECIEWQGVLNNTGYGMISIATGISRPTHRVAWYLEYGVWPADCILHSCDNRKCVNVAHMREGSKGDNNKDTSAKEHFPTGLNHHRGKLSDEDAFVVIELRSQGWLLRELSDIYGVHQSTISMLCLGKTRPHIWRRLAST